MAKQTAAEAAQSTPLAQRLTMQGWRRLAVRLGAFFLILGGLIYFGGPPLLKHLAVNQLAAALHRPVSVERISINPYAMSLRIEGLSVKTADGGEQAGFDELFVNLSAASVFKRAAVLDELQLRGWRLAVTHLGQGQYDISDLLEAWMQPSTDPDAPPPRFSLNNIQLSDGAIVFDDRAVGKVHRISGITLALPFISSLPYQAEIVVEPAFAAEIDGAALQLRGSSKPFATSHESELSLELADFDLTVFQNYLPAGFPLRVSSGRLGTALKAVFKESPEHAFSLAVVGGLQVDDLAIAAADGQPLLAWKQLAVTVDRIDPLNSEFALEKIALNGLRLDLAVSPQGQLNLQALANQLQGKPSAEPARATPAAPARPVRWSLGRFELGDASLRWRDASQSPMLQGEVRQLQARVGPVDSRLGEPLRLDELSLQLDFGERLRAEQIMVRGVSVDLPARRVEVAEVRNGRTRLQLSRNADGEIVWLAAPRLANPGAPSAPSATDSKPWQARLGRLDIDDLAVRFEDRALQVAAIQEIDGLTLHAENLGTGPSDKGRLNLGARINRKGKLNVAGSVQLAPLDLALTLESVALPLMPLQPYFGEYLNVAVNRGVISNRGDFTLRQARDQWLAGYRGSLTLGDFLAVDKLNSADFLKWKSLYFGGIDFRLAPLAINIGEIALADFYSRVILDPQGRLNLANLVRKPTAAAPATPPEGKTAPVAASSPPVPVRIGTVSLQNGTVNFSDFFVQPNYTVNLSKLGGRVSGLSSAEGSVADLDLRGSYANAAPVQIVGKLNPLAAKAFLDLKADVTGVDLVGFSPYAGKYAGYAIDKGKLSLNVAYKLENQHLSAENRLFIDQLTFGDKVDSPTATTLPVNLAIALLKNNRGEIDLNLPISGSLDDPEFSVGGLIVKVVVNLFVKAVSSPFALLGSMFGGGEELSALDFAPGRASLDVTALGKLQALAKALNERQALKLEITGKADPETDTEGLKRVALLRAMQAAKARETLKRSGEGVSLDSVEIAPSETLRYLTLAYDAAKFPKPRNVVGLAKTLPQAEMEKLMLANAPVSDEDVRRLASQRAEAAQAWLVETGKVPLERIFLLPSKITGGAKGETPATVGRVDFSLR